MSENKKELREEKKFKRSAKREEKWEERNLGKSDRDSFIEELSSDLSGYTYSSEDWFKEEKNNN